MPTIKENQSISALQDQLDEAQRIDVGLRGDKNRIQRLIDRFAVTASLYSNPAKLRKLIEELEAEILAFTRSAGKSGKLLAQKEMTRFLEDSERRALTANKIRLINEMNARQAKRRADVMLLELNKNANILKSDIKVFKANAKLSGFTEKQILTQLVQAAGDKAGIAQGFAKKVKGVTRDAIRRERFMAKTEEFRKVALPNEKWTWITVSTKPCPDCVPRAGVTLTFEQWLKKGLPGSGRTICDRACKCQLIPQSVADDQFPTIRRFEFKPEDTVLATKSELRTFKAKSNQDPDVSKRVKVPK